MTTWEQIVCRISDWLIQEFGSRFTVDQHVIRTSRHGTLVGVIHNDRIDFHGQSCANPPTAVVMFADPSCFRRLKDLFRGFDSDL